MRYLSPSRRRGIANTATALLITTAAALAIAAVIMALIANASDAVRFGAAAAGLSVVVIGIQAWETRRASEAAQRALQHAEANLGVSERTALEAARTQLDARAPSIQVMVAQPDWPPCRPPRFRNGGWSPIGYEEQFHLPRDAQEQVLIAVTGVVRR
jgi:hypothetical protein